MSEEQLSECRDLALRNLDEMRIIIDGMQPVPYAPSQQVAAAAHQVRKIELGGINAAPTTTEPG